VAQGVGPESKPPQKKRDTWDTHEQEKAKRGHREVSFCKPWREKPALPDLSLGLQQPEWRKLISVGEATQSVVFCYIIANSKLREMIGFNLKSKKSPQDFVCV
jgi:hypothetical protein